MIANHDETLNALRRFIYANVPAGVDERRLEEIEHQTSFMNLEFRRDDVSCTLYIEIDSFGGESVTDENGDRYRVCNLTVKPSWPSYGSVPLHQADRFAKLVAEVTDFGLKILGQFPEPIVKLVETAEQIALRKRLCLEERCRDEVRSIIRANSKGMRVGQVRRVEVEGPDLLPVGLVTFCDGGREYTTNVGATRTVYVTRTL